MNIFKNLYFSKPWIMYLVIGVIILGAGFNIFLNLNTVLKIIIAVIVCFAFIILAICFVVRENNESDKLETISLFKVQVKSMTDKTVDNIMLIMYAAVVVFGTFIDSLMVVCLGVVLSAVHTISAIIARIFYAKKYRN